MPSRDPSLRPRRAPPQPFGLFPLELISDEGGAIAIGWIAESVLYARLTRGISAELGQEYAARLQAFAESVSELSLFIDFSAIVHYDLLARSAFVRAVLPHRRRFRAITLLSFSSESTLAERSFVSALGEPIDVLRESAEFEVRLLSAAPHARQLIAHGARAKSQNSR